MNTYERYLSDEDIVTVKKVLKGDMRLGIIILIIWFGFIGIGMVACIKDSGTVWDFTQLVLVDLFALVFIGKFLLWDSIQYLRRLETGVYALSHYEIIRTWSESFGSGSDKDYRYYMEAICLDDDIPQIKEERIDSADYHTIQGYKYAYRIHFYVKNREIKKLKCGITIDSTKAGKSFFYKVANELE